MGLATLLSMDRCEQARNTLAILMVATLPSCMTIELWALRSSDSHSIVVENHPDSRGRLVADSIPHRLLVELDPIPLQLFSKQQTENELAHALLMQPELLHLQNATVTGKLRLPGEQPGSAELLLAGRIDTSLWCSDVIAKDLSPAIRSGLVDAAATQSIDRPELKQCADRLHRYNLQRIWPEASTAAHITALVFVNGDGVPVGTATPPAPTYSSRYRGLHWFTLYARLVDGKSTRTVRIHLANFWLATSMQEHDGLQTHRSNWVLSPANTASPSRPQQQRKLDVHLQLTQERRGPPTTSWLLRSAQVVLTPVALLADVVVTPALFIYYGWIREKRFIF